MNAFINVARREIVERKNVFIAALVAGFVPYLAQLLRTSSGFRHIEARDMMLMVIVAAFVPALAIVLGVSMIGRDLSERRLSFYLTRPVGASSLWFGKVLGNLATLAVATLLILLPVGVANRLHFENGWSLDPLTAAAIFAVGSVVLFLAAHCISTVVRSRSPFVAVDVVCLIVTVALVFVATRRVLFNTLTVATWLLAIVGGITLLTLATAGIWQISRGRAERRASHRALSSFLWWILLPVAALANLFSIWFVSPRISELTAIYEVSTRQGSDWIWVEGAARHRTRDFTRGFLYNVKDGRSVRSVGPSWTDRIVIAPDGKRALLLTTDFDTPRATGLDKVVSTLFTVDLTTREPRFEETAITDTSGGGMIASPSQRRVALRGSATAVYDVKSGDLLASFPLDFSARASFEDENHLIAFVADDKAPTARLLRLDIPTRKMTEIARLSSTSQGWQFFHYYATYDAQRQRLLYAERLAKSDGSDPLFTFHLFDIRAGARIWSSSVPSTRWGVRLLRDGRVAFLQDMKGQTVVHLEGVGVTPAQIVIPREGVGLFGERSDGLLLTGVYGSEVARNRRTASIALLDPQAGRIVTPFREHLVPLDRYWSSELLPSNRQVSAELFGDPSDASLVRADLASGKRTRILGGE